MPVLALFALASCSSVDEADRLIYVKPADVARKVLIEDFTGQRCVNCPLATEEIEQLQQTYGDSNVIAVGIHSGPLGFHGNTKVLGLATDEGDEYYNAAEAEYQPVGMVNRIDGLHDYTQWGGIVMDQIKRTAPIAININFVHDEQHLNDNEVYVAIDIRPIDTAVKGKLQLWLVEDSITALQLMPDGSANYDYVHNHVFRKAINGTWGEDITLQPQQNDLVLIKSFNLDPAWNRLHLAIVAFVYNSDGVLQVEKKYIDN